MRNLVISALVLELSLCSALMSADLVTTKTNHGDEPTPAVHSTDFIADGANSGGGWTLQNSGVTTLLYSVKPVDENIGWVGGAAGVVLRTTNGGTNWKSVGGGAIGTATVVAVQAFDTTTAWAASNRSAAQGGGTFIHKTTNGGATWTQVYANLDPAAFINAMKMYDGTTGIATGDPVGGKWMILKTTNGGSSWARIASEPLQVGTEVGAVNGLATYGTSHIWFTPSGSGSNVYRSTDGGVSWTFSTLPFSSFVGAIAFNDPLTGILGASIGQALRSTDGGATWTPVTFPGTGGIYVAAGSGLDFFLPRGTNIYRSTDSGVTWDLSFAASSSFAAFRGVNFYVSGSTLTGWATGQLGGIAAFNGTLTDVRQEGGEAPSTFMLSQNYPNPFNPSTTIRYSIPAGTNGLATLRVYDLLGREVATLVNEAAQPGTYETQWDASSVASGVYLYKLAAGQFTETKKLVLPR